MLSKIIELITASVVIGFLFKITGLFDELKKLIEEITKK